MSIEHLTVDGMNWEDGYVKLVLTTERDSAIYKSANITKLNIKGDVDWSRDLVVEDSLELLREGDLLAHSSGSLATALSGMKDSLSQFIVLTDNGGNVLWSKKYAIYQDSSAFDEVKPRLAESYVDNHIFYANKSISEGKEAIYISKVDASTGNVIWSNYIENTSNDLVFGSISACMEGGVMIAGIDAANQQYVISKLDENGNILYNKSLQTGVTPNNSFANSLLQLQDSTYVLAGSYFVGVEYDGYVIKLDSLAEVDWANRIDFDFSANDVYLMDLVQDTKGDILMSAKQIGILDTAAFGIKFDLAGDVVWQNKYKETAVDNIQLGGLGLSWTGGMSYFLTGGNEEEQYISYLIAADSMGMTICSDTIAQNIVFDADFQTDTLELVNTEFLSAYILECCDSYQIFEREQNNVVNASQVSGSNVYFCTYVTNNMNEEVAAFSKLDLAGNIVWSFEMNEPSRFNDFIETDNGDFIVVGRTHPNVNNKAIILQIDSNGTLIHQIEYDTPGRNFFTQILRHANPLNVGFEYYVSGSRNPISNNPSLTDETVLVNLDADLSTNWINIYTSVTDTQTDAMLATADGNLILNGDSGTDYFGLVTEINGMDGSVILSRRTANNNDFNEMIQLANGNYLAIGAVRQSDITTFYALVSVLDPDLNLLSADYFALEELSAFRDITYINDTNFYLTAIGSNNEGLVLRYEILNGQDLNLAQVNTLRRENVQVNPEFNFSNGTFVFAETGGNSLGYGDFTVGIGSDMDILGCMNDTTLMREDYTISFDTLATTSMLDTFGVDTTNFELNSIEWETSEYCFYQEFMACETTDVSSMAFGLYTIPVLTLEVMPLCPNEPIDWTFNAFTPGAVSYLWQDSDGNNLGTADTLNVDETGTYNVIVTIGEDVCFTLCDTATLETYNEPSISISQNASILCETGELILIASPSAEAGVDTVFWSTGEEGTTINVSTPGTVTVTLIDNCGIEVTDSFDPDFNILEIPEVIIQLDSSIFCSQGIYQLTAVPNGTTTAFESFMWSTGETTNPIFITQGGTYGVTIIDECNLEASSSIEIDDFPLTVDAISIDRGESMVCDTDPFTLELITTPSNATDFSIFWTTGGTQNVTTINEGGTYGVSVTDYCGNFYTDEIEIEEFPSIIDINDPATRPDSISADTLCISGESILTISGFLDTGYAINWSNGDTNVESIIVPADSGEYTVEIIDLCGNEYSLTAEATDCEPIQWPNVFTPGDLNMDGINIAFGPVGSISGIVDYELNVFNRWGEKVFESTDPEERWDGMYKEKDQASDLYMWYSTYTWFGIDFKEKGSITLVR